MMTCPLGAGNMSTPPPPPIPPPKPRGPPLPPPHTPMCPGGDEAAGKGMGRPCRAVARRLFRFMSSLVMPAAAAAAAAATAATAVTDGSFLLLLLLLPVPWNCACCCCCCLFFSRLARNRWGSWYPLPDPVLP